MGLFKTFFIFLIIFLSTSLQAQLDNMTEFVEWDNGYNLPEYGAKKEWAFQKARFFEIEASQLNNFRPEILSVDDKKDLNWLDKSKSGLVVDKADYLPDGVHEVFFFKKLGKEYFRVFIHPGDQLYWKDLARRLRQRGIRFEIKHSNDFKVAKLASRSFIVKSVKTGRSFSMKTQTSEGSVIHGDELHTLVEAFLARRMSDYFWTQKDKLKYLDVAWEALGVYLSFDGFEFHQSVRLMENVSGNAMKTFSGFVYMHKEESQKIARQAGRSYNDYWHQAMYIKGHAMAELSTLLGWNFAASAHSQNFRWTLNNSYRVVGVTVLDLVFGQPNVKILTKNGARELLDLIKLNKVPRMQAPNRILVTSFLARSAMGDFVTSFHKGVSDGVKMLDLPNEVNFKYFTPEVILKKTEEKTFSKKSLRCESVLE